MHVYVQKSTTTIFPRKPSGSRGGELSQSVAPPSEGRCPSTGSSPLRPINRSISHLQRSVCVHLEDRIGECLGCLLRQVVPDTSADGRLEQIPFAGDPPEAYRAEGIEDEIRAGREFTN